MSKQSELCGLLAEVNQDYHTLEKLQKGHHKNRLWAYAHLVLSTLGFMLMSAGVYSQTPFPEVGMLPYVAIMALCFVVSAFFTGPLLANQKNLEIQRQEVFRAMQKTHAEYKNMEVNDLIPGVNPEGILMGIVLGCGFTLALLQAGLLYLSLNWQGSQYAFMSAMLYLVLHVLVLALASNCCLQIQSRKILLDVIDEEVKTWSQKVYQVHTQHPLMGLEAAWIDRSKKRVTQLKRTRILALGAGTMLVGILAYIGGISLAHLLHSGFSYIAGVRINPISQVMFMVLIGVTESLWAYVFFLGKKRQYELHILKNGWPEMAAKQGKAYLLASPEEMLIHQKTYYICLGVGILLLLVDAGVNLHYFIQIQGVSLVASVLLVGLIPLTLLGMALGFAQLKWEICHAQSLAESPELPPRASATVDNPPELSRIQRMLQNNRELKPWS